jgi:hypothetical protein
VRPLLLLLALAVVAVEEPPALPPGQFCQHVVAGRQPPAHPCACQRECVDNIEIGDDGQPHETISVREDAQCKQYCHADHCHCPMRGCD